MKITLLFCAVLSCLACKDYLGNPHTVQAPRTVPAQPDAPLAEPANWWTGMKLNQVEILLQHPDIAGYSVKIGKADKVELLKTEPGDSPNYRFVTLKIDPKAPPQRVPLIFTKGVSSFTFEYPIRQRNAEVKALGVNPKDVIYLVMPDRFSNGDPSNDRVPEMLEGPARDSLRGRHGGDLQGIINHLDYLKDLGVTAVWLNPELENDQTGDSFHGYAITDLYHVDRRLGSNELLHTLAQECHRRGLKLVRDVVLNHIGVLHPWLRDLPTRDWLNQPEAAAAVSAALKEAPVRDHQKMQEWVRKHWPPLQNTSYRAPVLLDPYASDYDRNQFSNGWFTSWMPDLNQRNPHVANYLIQQAIWWIEYAGLDDLRIDTYTYSDQAFCSRWCAALKAEYPQLNMFGEVWENTVPTQGFYADDQPIRRANFDSNLPGVVDFQLCFAINEALTREQGWTEGASKIWYTLAQDYFYENPLHNVTMLDNHDLTRFFTVVGENVDKFKSGMACLLTMRGIPQIYYGTEILMAGSTSPNDGLVRKDFPGGWAGDPANKFVAAGRTPQEEDAFRFVRTLLHYRAATPALQTGKLMQFVPQDGVYVYFRYDEAKTVMVVLNTANQDREVKTGRFAERMQPFRKGRNVLSGAEIGDLSVLKIPKNSPLVLELLP